MSKYSYERILETVPVHLQSFVIDQNYARYTPQDQAVWRYVMRKNINFLSQHAHPSYMKGLEKTGIGEDKIPDVEEINKALDKMGWRAVVVNGFIPPAAFMEFQAHKILVISAEMRTIEHILYTPAPDILHEAAGHAPFIADETYAEFLQKFGEYGSKAMASKMDFEVYEAIRHLSIIKEYPDTSEEEIKKAEETLAKKIEDNKVPSEAALLSRLHWWTVEYGLIGSPKNFKQYGAGLLSSVGESQHCLNPEVVKIPLSINCIDYNYDITTMQPQLFVAEDWRHLIDVLEEFASTMCFRKGGKDAINMAVGENIRSGFAGAADRENFNVLPPKSDEITIEINYSEEKKHLFTLYQQVRDMRDTGSIDLEKLVDIEKEVSRKYPKEWLLHFEIVELVKNLSEGSDLLERSLINLDQLKKYSEEYDSLITDGLALLKL